MDEIDSSYTCGSCGSESFSEMGKPKLKDGRLRQTIVCSICRETTNFVYSDLPKLQRFCRFNVVYSRRRGQVVQYVEGIIEEGDLRSKPPEGMQPLRESVMLEPHVIDAPIDVRDRELRLEDAQEIPVPVLVGAGT